MAEESRPTLPNPQPGSQPGSRSHQNQPPNRPTQNPNQPKATPVFATKDLFRATIARLEKAKIAQIWIPPKMDAGLAYDLGAETSAPEFISMGIHIDLNQPQPGENPKPQKNGLRASTDLPASCFKLAKATELIYHTMPDHEIRDCLPKHAKTSGYLYRLFGKKICDHVSAVSRTTLDRGFQLACTIVAEAMEKEEFYELMNQSDEAQRAVVINGLVKPMHVWYLFRDQFRAVSFPFIFHDGVRTDPVEESLRMDLRRLLRYTTAVMVYDYLRFCISAEEGKENTPIPHIGAGKSIVRANYHDVPNHGYVRAIVRSLRRLPASPDFEDVRRRQSGGRDKSGGKGATGGKRKKKTKAEKEKDGRGIAKRSE
ncbi:hypothetical protein VE02_02295 [Pseudogymnoascus sp. 03VT05]|nr:hypothetical protein VE02_02295 [Pseudogymnoascus sp. 03VT05]